MATPRLGSGSGFGAPGGGSSGPGGGCVIVVKVMAKPLLRPLRINHRQDHQITGRITKTNTRTYSGFTHSGFSPHQRGLEESSPAPGDYEQYDGQDYGC